VGEKTPAPPGPLCIELSALGALETPAGDVPVEISVVDPADEDAPVDELPVPLLLAVVETASWPGVVWAHATNAINIRSEICNRLIVPATPFEPRLEQETRNRIVIEARSNPLTARLYPTLLFQSRAISSGELDIKRPTTLTLDPEPTPPRTSTLPG
jgi:hypothetical protein